MKLVLNYIHIQYVIFLYRIIDQTLHTTCNKSSPLCSMESVHYLVISRRCKISTMASGTVAGSK